LTTFLARNNIDCGLDKSHPIRIIQQESIRVGLVLMLVETESASAGVVARRS
jgi:hypothetical protein